MGNEKGFSSLIAIFFVVALIVTITGGFNKELNIQEILTSKNGVVPKGDNVGSDDVIFDCGTTDYLKRGANNLSVNMKDPVATCLGEGIKNCRTTKAIIVDEFRGSLFFDVIRISESDCKIKLTIGDANQITYEENKKYANKYLVCSISKLEKLIEQDGFIPANTEAQRGFNFVSYMENIIFVAEENRKMGINEGDCSGDILDVPFAVN